MNVFHICGNQFQINQSLNLYIYRPVSNKPGSNVYRCVLCKGYHSIRLCRRFIKMTPLDRSRTVRQHKYCINCLAKSHMVSDCTSKNKCRKCRNCHHTLLHPQNNVVYSHAKNRKVVQQQNSDKRVQSCTNPRRQKKKGKANQATPSSDDVRGQRPSFNNTASPSINQHILSDAIRSLASVLCAVHNPDHNNANI